MKRTLLILTFVGFIMACLTGFAQTAAPGSDASPPAPAEPSAQAVAPADAAPATAPSAPPVEPAAATADAAQPPAADSTAPAPEAPAPASQEMAANDAATSAAAPATPAGEEKAAATEEQAPASDSPAGDPAAQAGTVIPLIVMDDVPLTDAIRNLARQSGLNYMLDPKLTYGQVGPDGKVTPQPSVTIRWENITAGQALNALLDNYSLQLVQDPKSKIARVTIKDPAAPPPLLTKIIQLKYASPTNVEASVKLIFTDKRSKAMPDIRTSQLVVIATENEMMAVDELVERLDTITRQVLIEARILETTVNPKTVKGINWEGTLAAQHFTAGNNGFTRADGGDNLPDAPIENGTSPIPGGLIDSPTRLLMNASRGSFFNPSMAFLNADGVSAFLSFLNTYSEVREISSPRSVTLDNEKAIVEVGMLYPIVNITAGTANTTGGSQITYSNLTIRLEVTPRISANDYVNLMVTPSITKLGPQFTSVIDDKPNIVDSFLTRNMTTKVMVPSGNSLVMGGLIQDQINTGNTKVPLLGDIPVLGYLFRHDSKDRNKTDLVLFITPTIVQDENYQPTEAPFLNRPVPKSDSLEGDWSAWDSGKPKDWSNKEAAAPEFKDPEALTAKYQNATPVVNKDQAPATPEFQDPDALTSKYQDSAALANKDEAPVLSVDK